jgi:hypothetical protein
MNMNWKLNFSSNIEEPDYRSKDIESDMKA